MAGWYGGKWYGGQWYAGTWYRAVVVPAPTPAETPASPAGLQERSGREGGFLVPPGFPLPVFGKFSKEVSDPWFGRQNPYGLTEDEKEKRELEELVELMEILD